MPWAKASKRSWQDDDERARPLKEFFKAKRLRDITPMLIEKYKQLRLKTKTLHKRERSPATVNRELQVLSKVFSMAYDNGLVEANPMRRVHKLREAPARERYLTDDEEKRLFEILVGRRAHVRPIVVVALQTGMRQGEILGMTWANVDFEQKTIYVAHTKTGRPRKLPMNNPVEVELRSLKQDASSEEHVFSYARTGLKLTTFRHAWEGACTEAKISGLRFHDLRHTFATRLRGKGVHEMDIMTLLGHTTLQMTSRYTHAMPENLRTAVDSLNKHPLPFRPRPAIGIAPKSRQVATGTEGA
jgi:integrase